MLTTEREQREMRRRDRREGNIKRNGWGVGRGTVDKTKYRVTWLVTLQELWG